MDEIFDLSGAPLILATVPAVMTLPLYQRLMGVWLDIAVRYGRIALVVDYRAHDAAAVSSSFIASSAAAFVNVRDRLAPHMAGQARVFDVAATNKVLLAYQWKAESPWPLKNFATVDDARAWAASLL